MATKVRKAKDVTSQQWQERYAGAVMNTFGPPKLVLARGEGAHVWDADGKEYVDLLGGIAVNALGHAHPALVAAVTEQLTTLGHVSNFFTSAPQVELAERLLVARRPPTDGSSSPTPAPRPTRRRFKLTRRTGRTHLVAAEGSFHGRTMGSLALTSKEAYRAPFEPLPGDVTFVPYGDEAALAKAVTDQTAAVILEPIQGEAGVVVPPAAYLGAAREITRDNGALLWLDEVQTGIGRTGEWFAGTGAPTPTSSPWPRAWAAASRSAPASRSARRPPSCSPATTAPPSAGNPVACAAALAVLDTIEKDGLLEHATAMGERLRAGLAADDARARGPRTGPARRPGPVASALGRGRRRGARPRLHRQQPDSRPCPPRSAPGHRPR